MLSYEEVRKISGENGLASKDIEANRGKYGCNVISPPEKDSVWKQFIEKFADPIIKILLVAVVISAIVAFFEGSGYLDTIAIFTAVILATGVAFISEYKSNKEFDVLNAKRDEMAVKVVRDGNPICVESKDIVVGDVILLEAGDGVPGDGWVIHSDGLLVNESVMTGESEPVLKEHLSEVRKGCHVNEGRGTFIVAAVGDNTQMGDIAKSLQNEHVKTPLELKLDKLGEQINKAAFISAGVILAILFIKGIWLGEVTGINLHSFNALLEYFMYAVVLIVVAVPEGLPLSVQLSLALAMRKMTRANNLVRRMVACETIGSATTICTDKTGTLTKNQMEVVESSVASSGALSGVPDTVDQWIGLNAAVNSTAYLEEHNGSLSVVGNSTEGALLQWLKKQNLDYKAARYAFPIIRQFLFNGDRKRMTTILELGGRKWALVKGAPEVIASLCNQQIDLGEVDKLASRAMRTLAFAHRDITGIDDTNADLVECDFTWDGYVGIRDQLRDDVSKAIKNCQDAGITVRMVTGDNIETARAIAKETGIYKGGLVLNGTDFRALSDDELIAVASDIEVLARAVPTDKMRLVQALQKNGDVVAVTGDGTNDAPALKNADVGLAMGVSGTEVAREASDIILLDDSFPTITNAVWWGRSLFENIQRFLQFQLTINVSAMVLVFLAPLLGFEAPFNIIQLLWINIVMDTLAALALVSEMPHAGLLKRKPVPKESNIISPYMIGSILITSIFYVVAGITHFYTGFLGGDSVAERGTVFFAAFILTQVWNGINCRAINGKMPAFFKGNPTFFGIMALIILIQIAMVQFGGSVFGTVPLSLTTWTKIFIYTSAVLVIGFVTRVIFGGKMVQ